MAAGKSQGRSQFKFSESDERLAVARFHDLMAKRKQPSNLGQAKGHASFGGALRDVLQRAAAVGGDIKAEVTRPHLNNDTFVVTDETLSPAQWAWLREKIIHQPQWVAERVGIERIGWLTDMKEPPESPTMKSLIDLYAAKVGLSPNEASRSKLFWKEFSRAVGITKISDLTHEHVAAYEKVVAGGKYAPKSMLHRYRKIRTILAYAI